MKDIDAIARKVSPQYAIWDSIMRERGNIASYEKVMVVFRRRKGIHDVYEKMSSIIAVFPCWAGDSHRHGMGVAYWEGLDALGPYPIASTRLDKMANCNEYYRLMKYLEKERRLKLAIWERSPSFKERVAWVAKGYS